MPVRPKPWLFGAIAFATCMSLPADAIAQGLQTDCVNSTVVGLRWSVPRGAPRHAMYEVRRDGAVLGTTHETALVDTSVAPSTTYVYSVALISGHRDADEPPTDNLEVSTPPAPAAGDAPYCPSKVIRSIEFDWNGYTEPNGSDLWPVTWGRDGKVYTFFGDGGGFGGDNDRGRASFGIASLAGTAPLDSVPTSGVVPPARRNIYGGFEGEHPSTLSGKAGSIIAVGRDFFGRGGIWSPAEIGAELAPKSSSPERVQIVYSRGNAYSWRAADWAFCSEEDRARAADGPRFCAGSFVGYGRGNAGAPDGRIYITGVSLATWLGWISPGVESSAAETFLARVKPRDVLDAGAYEYFAGLDARNEPIWERDASRMRPIFSDRTVRRPDCSGACPPMRTTLGDIVYDRAIRRYIGVAQGRFVGQTSFYDAPQPWGPWTVIAYHNVDPASGAGGWANLGTAGGESLGVHIVNAWTSADGLTLWMTYSSDGTAPRGALFPPEGTALDSFNLVRARLATSSRADRP